MIATGIVVTALTGFASAAVLAAPPAKAPPVEVYVGKSPFPQNRRENAQLVVIGCQQHACDRRNWTIYLNPASNRARVCCSATGAQSRWYNGEGGSRVLAGSCPS